MSAIESKLEAARRNLLDLSRRNRLLNLKPGSRSLLRAVDELPEAIFGRLVVDQRSMQFLAAEEWELFDTAPAQRRDGPAPDHPDRPAEEEQLPAAPATESLFDLASLDPGDAPAARHDDRFLQTALAGTALQGRLLNLARQAESAMQERGANVLYLALGLVEWCEEQDRSQRSLAPLLLVPVELYRSSARRRHAIRMLDDDVVVNPSLVELCRTRQVGLPPFDADGERPVEEFFEAASSVLATGWRLRPEVYLGLFSFAKHLMYLDLDDRRWPSSRAISNHPIIRGLLLGERIPGAALEAIAPGALDRTVPPQETFEVLDADASQLEAILAARSGADLVIEGPPGTGKSQTIANIIAECLVAGRTVLFVAEKAAALEVVQRRLERVGLGAFIAELHSRKASKRGFADELGRAVRAVHPEVPGDVESRSASLERLRHRLNAQVEALHRPVEPLGLTPYEAMGRCALLGTAPEAPVALQDVADWGGDGLERAEDLVSRLARAYERVEDPAGHPWRGVGRHELALEARQQVDGLIEAALAQADRAASAAERLASALGARVPPTIADAGRQLAAAEALLAAPSISADALGSSRFDETPADAAALIDTGRRHRELRDGLAKRWKPAAEQMDLAGVLARRQRDSFSILRWLRPSWWSDGGLIRAALLPGVRLDRTQSIEDLSAWCEAATLREQLGRDRPRGAALFGSHWLDDRSDWDALQAWLDATVALRRLVRAGHAEPEQLAEACRPERSETIRDSATALDAALAGWRAAWRRLVELLGIDERAFFDGPPDGRPFVRWRERLDACRGRGEALADWSDLGTAIGACRDAALGPLVDWALAHAGEHAPRHWRDAFSRQFHRLWVDHVSRGDPLLREFRGDEHEALAEAFCDLDRQWIEFSRTRVAATIAARSGGGKVALSRSSGLGLLQGEIRRRRGHKPIRKLLASAAGPVIQTIKPCFMMSPISIAQFLEPGAMEFDVVIFDEASQVTPEDALGAIARGGQIILVGDERQLPPTDFFTAIGATGADDGPEEADETVPTADLESVLALGQSCLPPDHRAMLRNHYRSRHDSLINFSNLQFYDGFLRVFPSPDRTRDRLGVRFHFVEGAVYRRGRGSDNPIEACAVAGAVLEHARSRPDVSLGVGAFSSAQQRAIQDEVERLRRDVDEPEIERFFSSEREEPFFVKNLETIQGDERDVILLSVGYGRDETGRLTMHFGPLNRDQGWRRLNVLVTRARQQCIVHASIRAEDFRLQPSTPRGVVALQAYLAYAERGEEATRRESQADRVSDFERAIAGRLEAEGWQVSTVVGDRGDRIDLAVLDPQRPGIFLAGIACDGASYRDSPAARDRERIHPAVLEHLGWRLVRAWSIDWLQQPQASLRRLLDAVARDGGTPPARGTAGEAETEDPGEQVPADAATERPPAAAASPMPEGMARYDRAPAARRGDRERLMRTPLAALGEELTSIVAVEGPIHRDELMRVMAARYRTRAGGQARRRLGEALRRAGANGLVELREQFIWPSAMERPPVRWRGADDAVTDADLICIEELAEAARLVAAHDHGVPRDELATAVVRALGFGRVGPQLAERADRGVQLAVESGLIRADPRGFMIAVEPA